MRLYSLPRGFLQRVHGRRLSPLSTRVRSLRPESLFERRENERSSWNPSLGATADYALTSAPPTERIARQQGCSLSVCTELRREPTAASHRLECLSCNK